MKKSLKINLYYIRENTKVIFRKTSFIFSEIKDVFRKIKDVVFSFFFQDIFELLN